MALNLNGMMKKSRVTIINGHEYYASIRGRTVLCYRGNNANVPVAALDGLEARQLVTRLEACDSAFGVDMVIAAAMAEERAARQG